MQSKGFAYKDQLRLVIEFLEEVDRSSDDGKFPASEEAVAANRCSLGAEMYVQEKVHAFLEAVAGPNATDGGMAEAQFLWNDCLKYVLQKDTGELTLMYRDKVSQGTKSRVRYVHRCMQCIYVSISRASRSGLKRWQPSTSFTSIATSRGP